MKKTLLSIALFSALINLTFAQTVIADFEAAGTNPVFTYFGSSLEPGTTTIIANPDPTGLNASAMVSDFGKPAGAEVWAGAFADGTQAAIDLSVDTEICMKVWFNDPGNVALKLESSIDGSPDWIFQSEVVATQEWTEICFNTLLPSIEAPFLAAAGGTYTGLVLFFDFGDSPAEDRMYFFDDIVQTSGGSSTSNITFNVDMSEYPELFDIVYVSGTFNNWSGEEHPMSQNSDGTWTVTINDIPAGPHEYKFTIDNWVDEERFDPTYTCTVTDANGEFTNRRLSVSGSTNLDLVCFNSCYACGESVTISINLGDAGLTVSPDGFFVAGGAEFGAPGRFRLTDEDGDGVHTIAFERPFGFESHYTFTNGACGDFSCKEDIAGQDCADPDAFNDRFMGPVNTDIIISTCFGQCTFDTDCETVPEGLITFQVDMSEYTEPFTQVFLSGTFNNWSADGNPLTDMGDGIWSTDLPLLFNDYQFKFQLDGWAVQETFAEGLDCTASDGTFINRAITVEGDDTQCFLWESCTTCEGVNNVGALDFNDDLFEINPTLVTDFVNLKLNAAYDFDAAEIHLISLSGERLISSGVKQHALDLDLSAFANGVYFIQVITKEQIKTQKLIRQ